MPYEIWAECPKCRKMARTVYEIDKLFGFRYLEKIEGADEDSWVKTRKMKS